LPRHQFKTSLPCSTDQEKAILDDCGRVIYEWIGDYAIVPFDGEWEVDHLGYGMRFYKHGICATLQEARDLANELIFEDCIRERQNYLHVLAMRMARSITYPPDTNMRPKTPGEMRSYCLARYGHYP
jgi:hypothetical protein